MCVCVFSMPLVSDVVQRMFFRLLKGSWDYTILVYHG